MRPVNFSFGMFLCLALVLVADVRASDSAESGAEKRYYGGWYGSPQECAWQACSVDTDCVAIETNRCGDAFASSRSSEVPARQFFQELNLLIDCGVSTRAPAESIAGVQCSNMQCELKAGSGTDLCQQKAISETTIRRCLADELDLCPEAAQRAHHWSLEPGYDAILESACNRNHAASCYVLGVNHSDKNIETTRLTQACELGHTGGCFLMGMRKGQEEPFNAWFETACDINLNYCLKIGRWLRSKEADSAGSVWLSRSCDKGHSASCTELESIANAQKARKLAEERALSRKWTRELEVRDNAREFWGKLLREKPQEMEGATFLGVEPSKPGYSVARLYAIRYITKDGETKSEPLLAR